MSYLDFEVKDKDLAGRIGRLTVGDYEVETPTIMPVINPNLQTVAPSELPEFGAEIAITNSYIIYKDEELREQVLDEGLKSLVDFPGPLMTDSGSFQLGVYGDIEVTSEEIVEFQREIGSDLLTPVDLPTAPDEDREVAEEELETTLERIEEARELAGERVVAPVQGSTYPELRRVAGERAPETGAGYFPVGAIVPLMESYRYREMVDVTVAAKRGLPDSAPVHLFGAGHPSFFALAAAMGGDLMDSAAYALFAKEGRYLTVEGTKFVEEMEYLPCSCPACTGKEPEEMDTDDLVRHNLHVTFGELRTVKQAIREGRLTELVAQRARSHPKMLEGWRHLLDAHGDWLEERDPSVKMKGMLYTGDETADRPEVKRHDRRVKRVELGDKALFAPFARDIGVPEEVEMIRIKPPFVYPEALKETYPSGQSEVPSDPDPETLDATRDSIEKLLEENDFVEVYATEFPYDLEVPGAEDWE